jgi:Holliday junction resolvase RusA-like endonuclease
MMFFARVFGIPGPQGSKRFVGRAKNGRGIMVESSKKVKPWREAVVAAALEANQAEKLFFDGAVRLTLQFIMPRNASAPRSYTPRHTKAPDLSKLIRSTEDALTTAAIWRDDSRVAELVATKVTAEEGQAPGCTIIIEALPEVEKPASAARKPRTTHKQKRTPKPATGDAVPYFV